MISMVSCALTKMNLNLLNLLDFWPVILFILSLIWVLIQMYFNQKSLKKEIAELKIHMDAHDESDKKMKDELIGLIDRNKLATEKESSEIKTQLSDIKASLAVVNNTLNLIVTDRLK